MSFIVTIEKDSKVEKNPWVSPKGKEYVFIRQEAYITLPDVKYPQHVKLPVASVYPEGQYQLQTPLILVGGQFQLQREFTLIPLPVSADKK